ncbi:helix-turn-helix domain-containing protein [Oceanicola sp. 22II-s10i]|uniref:helix-turn-helix domain-containing protein n=1 Tax=Oceanicola sp. 22II-s10i TaxID=1317116 RepID=UPI000B52590C|nr:helix-turn-helix domain-containing protein [Oceanicola sp. 22II-s10i]
MSQSLAHDTLGSLPAVPPGFRSELPDAVVKSAARTIQILEFFDHVRRDVSISEIAHALRYPQSSTSALLRSMVAMGYLQHNRTQRTYRLTRRTGLLGAWVDPSLVRQGSIVNLAHGLARHTGESVLLARMNERKVQVIYVAEGGPDASRIAVGCQHELATTAAGAALLSMLDDRQVRRLLIRLNAERPASAPAVDIQSKLCEIAKGRKLGHFTGGGSVAGTAAVASQLRHETAGDMLVIAVEGSEQRMLPQSAAIARLIRTGLQELSS